MPKKNGKTTLIAGLALYHLLVTDNAECIMLASSRDQAEIILRQARMFVRQSESLSQVMTIQQRTILSQLDDGRIRVLASDVDTADGAIPTLVIVDELHRHKNLDLYGVMMDGLGPRDGQMITISTAGSSTDSPLGLIRQNAYAMPGFTRKGKRNTARADDFAYFEWCLDPEDDVENLKVVKRANPAPWQTEANLARRKADPAMTTSRWLRFACGIWTETEEPWLEPPQWDTLEGPQRIKPGSQVILGVKARLDGSAVVMVDENHICKAHILPGADLESVEDKILELSREYAVHTVAYDPSAFRRSAELLSTQGLTMQEFPTTPERMSVASVTLKRLIETKELHHDGDKDFRAHILAGTVKESERGWRLVADPGRPIAALIALVMACQVAEDAPPKQEAAMAWA